MPVLFITAGWGKLAAMRASQQQYMEAMWAYQIPCRRSPCLSFGGGLAILLGFTRTISRAFNAGDVADGIIFHSNFAEGKLADVYENPTIAGGFYYWR